MRTIYKTQLKVDDFQTIFIPQGSKILHIDVQQGVPCIWYECDNAASLVGVDIYCCGTGFDMSYLPDGLEYIGTVQIDGYVWHYYRRQ